MPTYSLYIQCLTEFYATLTFIFLGNSLIANELLTGTKGHSVGFGFVAIGYGLAIGFSIQMFGYSSAHVNPASVFGSFIKGSIPGLNVVPLMLSEILGAFVGAVLVYLAYFPHFQLIPELETVEVHYETASVLRHGLHKGNSALKIASHRPTFTSQEKVTKSDREEAIYAAAIEADKSTKLSVFSNRPAIRNYYFNFITEFLCTVALLLGVWLIEDRFDMQVDENINEFYSKGIRSIMVGLYVTICILCLGGPTGFSTNPARDLGPRIAHFVLPIKGKGDSDFKYSLVINIAAFAGGAAAAGLFLLFKMVPNRA